MRRVSQICVLSMLVSGFSGEVRGEVRYSHHDFSSQGWSGGELCVTCHTPHNANTTQSDAPLWNHQITIASYTVYTSSTMNAAPGQPNGVSKLCLSCHDGTVAIDSFGTRVGTRYAQFGRIGTDLAPHHPISFTYDSSLAAVDGELRDPASTPSGLGSTIANDLLRGGQLECTSCHDVHVERNNSGCTGCHTVHPMSTKTLSLRKSNDGSALCLTCHAK